MSNSYLGYSKTDLTELNGFNTAREIKTQIELWSQTFNLLKKEKSNILRFLKPFFSSNNSLILLTGAGTSAFIGDVLEPIFQKDTENITKSIPTTTLVTHPEFYFQSNKLTLLISFARSGDSPESIKAIELADQVCKDVYHLIITCNDHGQLAESGYGNDNRFVIVLPEGSNDKSLAMTGSFTSMLLAGILVSKMEFIDNLYGQITTLTRYGSKILNKCLKMLQSISEKDFNRAVFLGSGMFEGIARESQLKLQELTNGEVICKFDTFLGFRHGPKAVIKDKTIVIYLLSNDPYVRQYEKDLISSIHSDSYALYTLSIMEKDDNEIN